MTETRPFNSPNDDRELKQEAIRNLDTVATQKTLVAELQKDAPNLLKIYENLLKNVPAKNQAAAREQLERFLHQRAATMQKMIDNDVTLTQDQKTKFKIKLKCITDDTLGTARLEEVPGKTLDATEEDIVQKTYMANKVDIEKIFDDMKKIMGNSPTQPLSDEGTLFYIKQLLTNFEPGATYNQSIGLSALVQKLLKSTPPLPMRCMANLFEYHFYELRVTSHNVMQSNHTTLKNDRDALDNNDPLNLGAKQKLEDEIQKFDTKFDAIFPNGSLKPILQNNPNKVALITLLQQLSALHTSVQSEFNNYLAKYNTYLNSRKAFDPSYNDAFETAQLAAFQQHLTRIQNEFNTYQINIIPYLQAEHDLNQAKQINQTIESDLDDIKKELRDLQQEMHQTASPQVDIPKNLLDILQGEENHTTDEKLNAATQILQYLQIHAASAIPNMRNRITTITGRIATIQPNVTTLQGILNNLNQQFVSAIELLQAQQSCNKLTTDLTQLTNTDIPTITNQVNTVTNAYTQAAQDRVAYIQSLQNYITYLNAIKSGTGPEKKDRRIIYKMDEAAGDPLKRIIQSPIPVFEKKKSPDGKDILENNARTSLEEDLYVFQTIGKEYFKRQMRKWEDIPQQEKAKFVRRLYGILVEQVDKTTGEVILKDPSTSDSEEDGAIYDLIASTDIPRYTSKKELLKILDVNNTKQSNIKLVNWFKQKFKIGEILTDSEYKQVLKAIQHKRTDQVPLFIAELQKLIIQRQTAAATASGRKRQQLEKQINELQNAVGNAETLMSSDGTGSDMTYSSETRITYMVKALITLIERQRLTPPPVPPAPTPAPSVPPFTPPKTVIPPPINGPTIPGKPLAPPQPGPIPGMPPSPDLLLIYRTLEQRPRDKRPTIFPPPPPPRPIPAPHDQEDPESQREQAHPLYFIDISEIAKAMAWREAEKKVNDILAEAEQRMNSVTNSRWHSLFNTLSAPVRHPGAFGRKVWTRTVEDGYRLKFYQEALNEIVNDHNLMAEIEERVRTLGSVSPSRGAGLNRNRHFDVLDSVIQEYERDIAEQMEQGRDVNNPAFNTRIADLITRYITEGWDRARLERETRTTLNAAKIAGEITAADFDAGQGREREAEGLLYASNLVTLAQQYAYQIQGDPALTLNQPLTMDQMNLVRQHIQDVMRLDIKLGLKLSDLQNKRPKGTFSLLQRAALRCQQTPILGRIVNPLSIGAATAIGTRTLFFGGTTAVTTAGGMFAPILAGAGIAGGFGFMRRNKEVPFDRSYDQERQGLGENVAGGIRTDRMRRFEYDNTSIPILLNGGDHTYRTTTYSRVVGMESTPEVQTNNRHYTGLNTIGTNFLNQATLLANPDASREVAEMLARFLVEMQRTHVFEEVTRTGNRGPYTRDDIVNMTVDLFRTETQEGREYKTNLRNKANLKEQLYTYLRTIGLMNAALPDVTSRDIRATAGNYNISGLTNSAFQQLAEQEMQRLNEHINHQDEQFTFYRRNSRAVMGAVGFGVGLIGGVLGQKVNRLIQEHLLGKPHEITAYDWLLGERPVKGQNAFLQLGNQITQIPQNGYHQLNIDGSKLRVFLQTNGTIDLAQTHLPAGWSLTQTAQGSYQFIHTVAGQPVDVVATWDPSKLGSDQVAHISHKAFQYEGTPATGKTIPDHLLGAAEIARANGTELLPHYEMVNGHAVVDISHLLGRVAHAGPNAPTVDITQALNTPSATVPGKSSLMMLFSPDREMTQHNPLIMHFDLHEPKLTLSDQITQLFMQNKSGKLELVVSPDGRSMVGVNGLHVLAQEGHNTATGMSVTDIATRLGEPVPPVPGKNTSSLFFVSLWKNIKEIFARSPDPAAVNPREALESANQDRQQNANQQ